MNKTTENKIEKFAIELLEKKGYQYIYAPLILPIDAKVSLPLGETEERVSY